MRVLVTGAGRSCSNWVTEILRVANELNFTSSIEDRQFLDSKTLPEKYSTKLCTEYPNFTEKTLCKIMDTYSDLHLVFSVRNPVNNCLSKIARGRKKSEGGDTLVELVAKDSTPKTAVSTVIYSLDLFKILKAKYKERVVYVRLEDLILNNELTIRNLCSSLNLQFKEEMLLAYKNNRNNFQKQRYNKSIDTEQAYLYKKWDTIYDGLFKDKINDLNFINNSLQTYSKEFDYNVVVFKKNIDKK